MERPIISKNNYKKKEIIASQRDFIWCKVNPTVLPTSVNGWGFGSLVRNVASTTPVPAGGVFDGFNQEIISIRTKRMLPCSWEVRAVPQQVAAYTLDTKSVPGASAEWGYLWG